MWTLILFALVYGYIANWGRAKLLLGVLKKSSAPFTQFTDTAFLKKVSSKVGIPFKILIQKSPYLFGYMPGIPVKPTLVISSAVVESFTKNELEWIIFHEAGHCLMWHVPKNAVAQILVVSLGVWITATCNLSLILTLLNALIFGILWYQIERIFEREADTYALANISNPQGMITANMKMKARGKSIFYKNELLTKLFTPHLTYDERMDMARKKLDSEC